MVISWCIHPWLHINTTQSNLSMHDSHCIHHSNGIMCWDKVWKLLEELFQQNTSHRIQHGWKVTAESYVWPFTPSTGILKPGQLAYANQKANLSHWSGLWGHASDWAHQQYPYMDDTLWKLKLLNLGPCPNHFWPQPLTGFVITLSTYHMPKKKKNSSL